MAERRNNVNIVDRYDPNIQDALKRQGERFRSPAHDATLHRRTLRPDGPGSPPIVVDMPKPDDQYPDTIEDLPVPEQLDGRPRRRRTTQRY